MNGIIEEGAWASCSFDLRGAPQQLVRHLEPGESLWVGYISGKRLLNVKDKNTLDCFKCKSPVKAISGLFALLGGMAIGVVMIASGPVGWVALGAVVLVAVGTALPYIAHHDCATFQTAGTWRSYHKTLLVREHKALVYNQSVLECSMGGLLIVSESKPAAQSVSDSMKYHARREIGVQILSNALLGWAAIYTAGKGNVPTLAAVTLTPISYFFTDIVFYQASPLQAGGIGAGFTALGYGMEAKFPGFGSGPKLTGLNLIGDGVSSAVGYGADRIEENLQLNTVDVIKSIEDSSNEQVDFSGNNIIATDN